LLATRAAIDSTDSLPAITPAKCHPSWLITETVIGPAGAPAAVNRGTIA
jgi:hypothetical protein